MKGPVFFSFFLLQFVVVGGWFFSWGRGGGGGEGGGVEGLTLHLGQFTFRVNRDNDGYKIR